MKLKKLTVLIGILGAAPFGILAATNQNVPPCPTLSDLGVSSINNSNASLPMWIPGVPNCTNIPAGETCYVTWNLNQQAASKGWMFIINTPGKNPSDALNNLIHSGIFNAAGQNQPDSDEQWCKANANGTSVNYFSPEYSHSRTNSNSKVMIENQSKK